MSLEIVLYIAMVGSVDDSSCGYILRSPRSAFMTLKASEGYGDECMQERLQFLADEATEFVAHRGRGDDPRVRTFMHLSNVMSADEIDERIKNVAKREIVCLIAMLDDIAAAAWTFRFNHLYEGFFNG